MTAIRSGRSPPHCHSRGKAGIRRSLKDLAQIPAFRGHDTGGGVSWIPHCSRQDLAEHCAHLPPVEFTLERRAFRSNCHSRGKRESIVRPKHCWISAFAGMTGELTAHRAGVTPEASRRLRLGPSRLPIADEPEAGEAQQHHRPGRGFGNRAADDEGTIPGDRQIDVGSEGTQIDDGIVSRISV